MPTRGVAYGLLRSDKPFSKEESEGASIGKYPFMTWVNRYLKVLNGTFAETTLYDLERHYRRMSKELEGLVKKGAITTSNPKNMTMKDVGKIIVHYRNLGLASGTIRRDFSALNGLMLFTGNPSFVMFKMRNPHLFPSTVGPRQAPLEKEFVVSLLKKANSIDENDWTMLRAYALVLFAIGTGCRMKELRLAEVADLNLSDGTFHAERVKGEGTWGEPRDIPIRPEIMPILRRYLTARSKMLDENNRASTALFPALHGIDGYLSANRVRLIKKSVEVEMGKTFDIRSCRRTFGQLMLDEGISVETVSVVMGHKNSRTTELYYARRKQKAAIEEAKKAWNHDLPPIPEKTSIRNTGYISGYT
jgi:integrase/recombinase XerD